MHVLRRRRHSLLTGAIGILAGLSASRSYALSVRSGRQGPRLAKLLLFGFPRQALPIAHHAERHNGLRNRHASRESCLSQTADLGKLLLPTGRRSSVHIAAPSTHACTRNELPIVSRNRRANAQGCMRVDPAYALPPCRSHALSAAACLVVGPSVPANSPYRYAAVLADTSKLRLRSARVGNAAGLLAGSFNAD
ncbi:hypothetical protein AURDEDRAFT_177206 [Auricularia subglabra TFB-10046 SS5]|uniref:Uncharacterized protein n=1 Tax=Auricularia subglabra (strain TFB-10046 / SS5) TaxID=717982 RepID=J0D4N3_AURST|nr:hypothetical protein AURDEDRAFT_177206 [Auricularia subglabra TFB-10046 SS5]